MYLYHFVLLCIFSSGNNPKIDLPLPFVQWFPVHSDSLWDQDDPSPGCYFRGYINHNDYPLPELLASRSILWHFCMLFICYS